MKETIISVTEAARNFAECVSRAYYQNVTFLLLKNGTPVARLVPALPVSGKRKVCPGRELAEALKKADLPEEEARAWHNDLRAGRKALKPPADPWQ
jgi:hypothetical protein